MSLFWIDREFDQVETADPLALQGVTDRFAETLLPGLSVVTYRARYYSFFCWARGTKGYSPKRIHELEAKLAYREVDYHHEEGTDRCSFHGKRGAVKPGRRSSAILSTSSWNRGYRQSCTAMGLIEPEAPYALTESGRRLASLFGKASRSFSSAKRSALCALSKEEKKELRKILGYDFRVGDREGATLNSGVAQRADTGKAIRAQCGWWVDPPLEVLNSFASSRAGKTEQGFLLHQAAGWSHLCLGLSAIFYAYLQAKQQGKAAEKRMLTSFARARLSHGHRELAERDVKDLRCLPIALTDLARGLAILKRQRADSEPIYTDGVPDIADKLLSGDRIGQGIPMLCRRHHERRPEDRWLSEDEMSVEVAEDRIPDRVPVSGIRLGIWMSLRNDLYGGHS